MDKLYDLMAEIPFPSAYDHFAEGESPEPPFITYLCPGSDNFFADGKVYLTITQIHIELYTDEKNPEVWIASEKLYEVLYSFEMEVLT